MIWHKALFSFHGRLNRKGFWIGFGINFAFLFIFANFILNPTAFSWISVLPLTLSFFSLSAIIVKRLHDRNRSGKALMMVLVPILCYLTSLGAEGNMVWMLGIMMPAFISTILVMEWGMFAGNPEANQYGEKGLSVRFR